MMTSSSDIQKGTTSLEACRSLEDAFVEVIAACAKEFGVSRRALAVRSLLQVPRIAAAGGAVQIADLEVEVRGVAQRLVDDMRQFELGGGRWPKVVEQVSELEFGRLGEQAARAIFGHLHYLRSYRDGSVAYALFDPKTRLPLAACTVSPLQWAALAELMYQNLGVQPDEVLDVSRVFAFDEAPKNSISALLSRVRLDVRDTRPEVRLLSTAVDQNLGFSGSSYKASNWQLFCQVLPRPYIYIDTEYKTIRQIRKEFGEISWEELQSRNDAAFESSTAELLDSLIYVQSIKLGDVEVPSEIPSLNRGGVLA